MKNTQSTENQQHGPAFGFSTEASQADGQSYSPYLQGFGDDRDILASKIIFRLEFPKAKNFCKTMSRKASLQSKERKLLSLEDKQDAWQTVMAMMAQGVHLQEDGIPQIMRVCRDVLRINNCKGDYCDSLDYLVASGKNPIAPHKAEKFGIERVMRAKMLREQLRLVRRAFQADQSRQRKANRNNALRFLMAIMGMPKTPEDSLVSLERSTLSMKALKFRLYTSKK